MIVFVLAVQLQTEDRRLLLLAACLFPLRRATYTKGNKAFPITSYIIRDSLKWRTKEVDGVAVLHDVVDELAKVHARLSTGMTA